MPRFGKGNGKSPALNERESETVGKKGERLALGPRQGIDDEETATISVAIQRDRVQRKTEISVEGCGLGKTDDGAVSLSSSAQR